MPIKRYSSKEPVVFVWIITPYIVFMNLLIFGTCIFGSVSCFIKSFFTSAVYFFVIYAVFGSLAVIIKNRNPGAGDLFKRVRLMLPFFYLMNIGAVYGAFYIFRHVIHLGCVPLTGKVWWTILYGCIMSTVITFINEGMANWENWKNSLSESEKLKNAYQRSKLLGLKGQINPHFLFNCFNTLSGLIQENEEEAEKFLDEMTKVHRYLLRGDDDNPEIFNNQIPWDEKIFPRQDLAVLEIDEIMSWRNSLMTSFSLNNLPKSLRIIPAKSIYDDNSLNYMRSHSEIARKVRIFSYRLFGYPPEIPYDDNRNVSEWSGKE